MITWNDLKNLDVKDFDPTTIDLGRFDIRNVDLPKFEMPAVDLPTFDLPTVELPDLPAEIDRVAGLARDAAYAGVGVAVVTAQKLDEQRRELTEQVTANIRKLVDAVA